MGRTKIRFAPIIFPNKETGDFCFANKTLNFALGVVARALSVSPSMY